MEKRKLTLDVRIDIICGLKPREPAYGMCMECGKIFPLPDEDVVECPRCGFSIDYYDDVGAWERFTDGIKI